jgi:hypothetical protein
MRWHVAFLRFFVSYTVCVFLLAIFAGLVHADITTDGLMIIALVAIQSKEYADRREREAQRTD